MRGLTQVPSLSAGLGGEEGMTLVELLIAIGIGLAVLLAATVVMNTSFTQTAKVTDRVEAVQRGRRAMEQVTRQLRSQVCPSTTNAALTYGDNDKVTFYVDLSGGSAQPEQHTLTFDSQRGTLTEYDYVGTGTWPAMSYPPDSSPTRTRPLISNARAVSGEPVFSYYAFAANGTPTERLSTPLAPADLPRVVRIGVGFVSVPRRTGQPPQSTTFQNQVDVRTANPSKPSEPPRCL